MSDGIWKKNIAAMQQHYPLAAQALEKLTKSRETVEPEITVGVDEVCDKKVLYAVQNGEAYQLDTLYDSDALMELWYRNLPKIYLNCKILMYGLGNGMYADKLLQETSEDVVIIIYEPTLTILHVVMQEYDISRIIASKRVRLLINHHMDKTLDDCYSELLEYTDIDDFIYKSYLNYNRLYAAEYREYMDVLQNVCSAINSSQSVIGRYGRDYYENTFANFPFFLKSKSLCSLNELMPKDIPAIIVAAGPSLDKNILELKKAKGKAFIIAVDSALRPLVRNGIIPDICISIDGKKKTAHFDDEETRDIPLICYLISHREILSRHRAEKFFLNDLNHHVQHFLSQNNMVLPIVASGGSVANDAFSVLQILGFTTIILIGQDLALTGNKSHADATVVGELGWMADHYTDLIQVEGIDGQPILSKPEYKLYCNWFEEQIVKYPEIKVIDATEGGAMIHGSVIETLEEAIHTECTRSVDIQQIIHDCDLFFDREEQHQLIEYMQAAPVNLNVCLEKAKEGLRLYERMMEYVYKEKYKTKEFVKLFERTKEIGEALDSCPDMDYVKNRIQEQTTSMLKNVYHNEDEERAELIAACEYGRKYLQLIKNELEIVIPDIEKKVMSLS